MQSEPPNPEDRAYFPLEHDIQNHIQIAKRALQLSCLDQENVQLKIEQWKSLYPDDTHLFRPYIQKEAAESISTSSDVSSRESEKNQGSFIGNDGVGDAYSGSVIPNNCEQSLLWVHQTQWQQQLLSRYGNDICLLDATYKTTRYELPLFFVCVRTNCGYSVIAEFIVQSEDFEHIREAIETLKSWNPKWNPKTFMTDYSEAESIALQSAFPGVNIYLCDFHREQAWERWVRDHKHGLTQEEGEVLLSLLRACAWAPSCSGDDPDGLYLEAVKNLKESNIWRTHMMVQQWLNTKWLSIPERWARAFRDQHYYAAVDTNNGTESQNKLLKYKFLPRSKQKATMSRIITTIVESFLPSAKEKYVYHQCKQLSSHRPYKQSIPAYLHDHPHSMIVHCLDRKVKSSRFTATSVHDIDHDKGVFEIEKSSGTRHKVDFGSQTGEPSCTCKDWIRYRIPCKHFFVVFQYRSTWQWDSLPEAYLNGAYMSTDTTAVIDHFSGHNSQVDIQTQVEQRNDHLSELDEATSEIPAKKQISRQKVIDRIEITLKNLRR